MSRSTGPTCSTPPGRVDVRTAARTIVVENQAGQVLQAFDDAGLPVVVLKGLAYLASFRPISTGRRTTDIDLLVRPADVERAVGLLLDEGFRPWARRPNRLPLLEVHDRQAGFIRSVAGVGVLVDLHWELLSLDQRSFGFSIDHEGIWSRTVPLTVAGNTARRLSNEDLLLHSCLHHAVHDAGSSPRDLLDIAALCAQSPIDWAAVVERARAWGTVNPVAWALSRAQRQAGACVPTQVLARLCPNWIFRVFARMLDARADLPLERRFWGEEDVVRSLQASSTSQALSSLRDLAWPSAGWLSRNYTNPSSAWGRRLKHQGRFAWYLWREIVGPNGSTEGDG